MKYKEIAEKYGVSLSAVKSWASWYWKKVKEFVEATLDLYLKGDVDSAYQVAAMDEEINNYFTKIQDLATEEIKNNPEAIVAGRDYFQVISYLERIGDYAKNVCEWVIYLETGEIVEL